MRGRVVGIGLVGVAVGVVVVGVATGVRSRAERVGVAGVAESGGRVIDARIYAGRLRYGMKVGDRMELEADQRVPTEGGGEARQREQVTAWVLGTTEGGAAHVVLSQIVSTRSVDRDAKLVGSVGTWAGVGWVDLRADGRIDRSDGGEEGPDVREFFPVLPGEGVGSEGWNGVDTFGQECAYALREGKGAGEVGIEARPERLIDRVMGAREVTLFGFDLARRRVVSGRTEYVAPGAPGVRVTEMKLVKVERMGEAEVGRLAEEWGRYFAGMEAYERASEEWVKDPTAQERGAEVLKKLSETLPEGEVREAAGRKLAAHNQYAMGREELAAAARRLIGRAAPAFVARGIDGRAYRLADYRGRVVVLDFWNHACPPCMLAMPEMMAFERETRGRGVQVLGMYTNLDINEARRAAGIIGISYPVLMASRWVEPFAATSWPTVVVIDGEGVIRDVRFGYERGIKRRLMGEVEELGKSGVGRE